MSIRYDELLREATRRRLRIADNQAWTLIRGVGDEPVVIIKHARKRDGCTTEIHFRQRRPYAGARHALIEVRSSNDPRHLGEVKAIIDCDAGSTDEVRKLYLDWLNAL